MDITSTYTYAGEIPKSPHCHHKPSKQRISSMHPLDRDSVLGKWVEVIMDSDHSREEFTRRGKIVHVFSNPPAKEAIAIELEPEPRKRLFSRTKNRYLILEYPFDRSYSLEETLVSGSFAKVLRTKRTQILNEPTYSSSETEHIGFARVRASEHPPKSGESQVQNS